MKINARQTTAIIIVAVIGLIALGIASAINTPSPFANDKPTVVTTIFPLADITRNIVGDNMNVIQLLPGGASPHTYSITPKQLADSSNASILFMIGHNLDNWAADTLAKVSDIKTITVDRNIQLREFSGENHASQEQDHHEEEHHDEDTHHKDENEDASQKSADHAHEHDPGSIDPHYWLIIPNGKQIAQTIAIELSHIDPANQQQYEQNLENYLKTLDQTEQEIQDILDNADQKNFITIHDAWSYFASHYGLNLVASYEPVEGKQPSVNDLRNLQNTITQYEITTFFTEPQKQSTSATKFIEEDLNLAIKVLDPIGDTARRDSYSNTIKANITAITSQ